MSSREIAKFQEQFSEAREDWAKALPSHISPDRFQATVMTAVMRNPKLLTLDRRSLMVACMQAARQGLLPDGRDGAIGTFSDRKAGTNMAQWMPMTAGLIRRLRELGDLTSVSAYNVYVGDAFEVVLGDDPKIVHRVDTAGSRDSDKITASYAIFKVGDEVIHREIMTRAEIEQVRAASRAKNGSAWTDWFGEMARKTVIRRGAKSIPLSEKAAEIIEVDDQWFEPEHRDVADNPLNDDVIDIVAEAKEEPHDPETGEITEQVDVDRILQFIDNQKTAAKLERFADQYKEKLAELPAPAQGRVRSAYKSQLKKLRQNENGNH